MFKEMCCSLEEVGLVGSLQMRESRRYWSEVRILSYSVLGQGFDSAGEGKTLLLGVGGVTV